jgi:hypothetical protein
VVKPSGHKPPAMRREMVWVETKGFLGWSCSQCAWKFNPTGVPAGHTIAEMKQHYEQLRDDEFQSHRCADQAMMPTPTPRHKSQPKSKAAKK